MKENNDGNIPFYVCLALIFISTVLGLTYMVHNSNSYDDRGTFGDMFGFANAVFTGLSVVGLLYTILLQRKDLNIQREELKKQSDSTRVQNFENTFFNIVGLLNNSISQITISGKGGGVTSKGKSGLAAIRKELFYLATEYVKNQNQPALYNGSLRFEDLKIEDIMYIYNQLYLKHKNTLAHYYRTIYHIIKLIDLTENINKQLYISIITSQLSNPELVLLFYNGLHEKGINRFKPLMERYSMLENLDTNSIHWTIMLDYYDDKAYGEDYLYRET